MPTKYIAIAAAVIVVLGGAWYFLGNKGAAPGTATDGTQQTNGTTGTAPSGDSSGTFTGSLSDLAKRGGDYQCTFSQDGTDAKSSGTVYVSGYQIRGDFTSVIPAANMTVTTHMVQDGGYDYVWSSASPTGVKTKVTQTAASGGYAPTSGSQVNMGQAYSYKCVPWTVDKGKFSLPAGVQFTGN